MWPVTRSSRPSCCSAGAARRPCAQRSWRQLDRAGRWLLNSPCLVYGCCLRPNLLRHAKVSTCGLQTCSALTADRCRCRAAAQPAIPLGLPSARACQHLDAPAQPPEGRKHAARIHRHPPRPAWAHLALLQESTDAGVALGHQGALVQHPGGGGHAAHAHRHASAPQLLHAPHGLIEERPVACQASALARVVQLQQQAAGGPPAAGPRVPTGRRCRPRCCAQGGLLQVAEPADGQGQGTG